MIRFVRSVLKSSFIFALLALQPAFAADEGPQAVIIPPSIVTHNVPPLPLSMAVRLQRYANTRSASLAGWQGDELLVYTRFADSTQLHRVAQPLGYREQLTFLREPLGGVTIPQAGAKDQVILSWDVGGSEFDQLFLFDLKSGDARMVTDGESLYAYVIWAPDEASFVYVTTERNGRNWDIHVQDLEGNVDRLLETEDGYWFPIGWSKDGKSLLIRKRVSVNESSIYELDVASRTLTPLLGTEERMSIGDAAYDGRGGIFFTSDQASEFLRLHHLDRTSGAVEVVTQNVDWNVEGFGLSADYKKLVFVTNENGISKLSLWSLPNRKAIKLPELPQGVVTGVSFSPVGDKLGLSINSATAPSDVYVVDIKRRGLERWTASEIGGLDTDKFVDAELFSYESFDGLEIPAFIYRPDTPGPHPVVISIHGGPEAQYRPYFSTTVQSYVSEMNVAVIAPNVRGSNGYGKSYLDLDNGKLREDSVKDIGSLLDWIETQDDLDAERVAVIGGSYGGYMVLACMVHFGDRLTAAVESVGISSFVTFLENTQPYRQDIRRVEYGDERDPDMRAFLETISPLNHVDKMVTPVIISQGANDPRVPASESEQIRLALEASGVPAWYVLAKDEGHGFRKKVNRDYDRAAKFAFLEAYLLQE
jgi:dipeptidyl aminopeptidase/acylaminoacyl peptidase